MSPHHFCLIKLEQHILYNLRPTSPLYLNMLPVILNNLTNTINRRLSSRSLNILHRASSFLVTSIELALALGKNGTYISPIRFSLFINTNMASRNVLELIAPLSLYDFAGIITLLHIIIFAITHFQLLTIFAHTTLASSFIHHFSSPSFS